MENKRISELPAAETVRDEALFVAEQDGAAVKMTAAQLMEYAMRNAAAALPDGDGVEY